MLLVSPAEVGPRGIGANLRDEKSPHPFVTVKGIVSWLRGNELDDSVPVRIEGLRDARPVENDLTRSGGGAVPIEQETDGTSHLDWNHIGVETVAHEDLDLLDPVTGRGFRPDLWSEEDPELPDDQCGTENSNDDFDEGHI